MNGEIPFATELPLPRPCSTLIRDISIDNSARQEAGRTEAAGLRSDRFPDSQTEKKNGRNNRLSEPGNENGEGGILPSNYEPVRQADELCLLY